MTSTGSSQETAGVDDQVTVARWRRYGKDRLYVAAGDESKVGWYDLTTEEPHPEQPEHLPVLLAAVQQWKSEPTRGPVTTGSPTADASAAVIPPALPPEPVLEPSPPTELAGHVARPWIDLATNRAGAEAREQALAAREAAPVKTLLARALGVKTDERSWRIGADGEEKVAAQLEKVAKKDSRWRFLHAVPVGNRGSDIDHVVIGPGGVFTVNAKHHPGAKIWVGGNTFLVDGHRQPYIRNSRHEAARAAERLTAACGFPIHVEGLVVTVNADDVVVKGAPDGVHVVPRMQVARWLLRHGDIHTTETVDAIYETARRSTTWRP